MIKKIMFKLLPRHSFSTYSQLGEDIALSYIFQNNDGFYIDVGANHPQSLSNSFALYERGWNGLVIDGNKKLIDKYKFVRPRDICINEYVSDEVREVTCYEFDSDTLTTIDYNQKKQWEKINEVKRSKNIKTKTLDQIIDALKITKNIDLLMIDVEGHDFNVLKSINLKRYRPKVIIIEMHDFEIDNHNQNEIYRFLTKNGYRFLWYFIVNGYFINKDADLSKL
jgi:FkbM family methyltransferase